MKIPPGSLDLTSLRLLLAVVDERNFSRAAARENIAVSAISRRISNLELRLGVTLLHRHERGVEPTPAAHMISDRIRGVLDLLAQIVDDLSDVRNGTRGLIRVQAHTTAAAGILPGLLATFLEENPDVDISVDEATSNEILHAIRHGLCDLGLIAGTVDPGELQLIPWDHDELVAVIPQGHPLARHAALRLETMLPFPFVGMHRDSALMAIYRGHARALGKPLIERAHVTGFDVAGKMVGQGLGVAILPAEPARLAAQLYNALIRPLDEPWATRPLALCIRNLEKSPASARALVAFLRAKVRPATMRGSALQPSLQQSVR